MEEGEEERGEGWRKEEGTGGGASHDWLLVWRGWRGQSNPKSGAQSDQRPLSLLSSLSAAISGLQRALKQPGGRVWGPRLTCSPPCGAWR